MPVWNLYASVEPVSKNLGLDQSAHPPPAHARYSPNLQYGTTIDFPNGHRQLKSVLRMRH
jgi:hypothetical protein